MLRAGHRRKRDGGSEEKRSPEITSVQIANSKSVGQVRWLIEVHVSRGGRQLGQSWNSEEGYLDRATPIHDHRQGVLITLNDIGADDEGDIQGDTLEIQIAMRKAIKIHRL